MALMEVGVGEVENEGGGGKGGVLSGVGSGDVGLQGEEVFIFYCGCHLSFGLG